MRCPRCGFEAHAKVLNCPNCGKSLLIMGKRLAEKLIPLWVQLGTNVVAIIGIILLGRFLNQSGYQHYTHLSVALIIVLIGYNLIYGIIWAITRLARRT